MVKWNGPLRSDRSNREKRSTSKGGPLFSKLFRLDLTDPFSFRPKFPEILVEWIAPIMCISQLGVWADYQNGGKSERLLIVFCSQPLPPLVKMVKRNQQYVGLLK